MFSLINQYHSPIPALQTKEKISWKNHGKTMEKPWKRTEKLHSFPLVFLVFPSFIPGIPH
jgi:hypothetical protein